jgi:protein-S-isoprenylcysteine O-methyltransferase Ste14
MRRKSGWRVPLGWAFGILGLWLACPTPTSLAIGLPFALLGEVIRLWASAHIEKTKALATGGPYAHTRNPLYLGSLCIVVGVVVSAASPWVAGASALYFLCFYPSVIGEEARFLREKFGDGYDVWAKAVPAFWPRISPGGPRTSRFSWARVTANREWRSAAALPAAAFLLFARYWFARG